MKFNPGEHNMEWLILLVVVPAIVAPIVLLCGFAGCSLILDIGDPKLEPGTPTNLHAKLAANRKDINLVWTPTGGEANSFAIGRTATGEANASFSSTQPKFDDTSNTLKPGVTFHYTVSAIIGSLPPIGPSNDAFATIPPAAPVLSGLAVSAVLIRLNWTPSPGATRYRLRHLTDNTVIYEGDKTTADHSGVQPGTHVYEVVAIVGKDNKGVDKGFDDSLPKDVLSDAATKEITAGPVTPPNWVSIFPTTANIQPNPNNGVDASGDCIVQRIKAPAVGGNSVRVTLRGIANELTRLTAVTISKAVPDTVQQAQNSVDQPVDVKFGGASGVTLPINGTPQQSDPVNYAVAPGQDLHIAFDVHPQSGRIQRKPRAGEQAYRKNNAAEAALTVRPPQYNANNNVNVVYCIETIEVA